MIEQQLSRLILEAISAASSELGVDTPPEVDAIEITRPERKEFGDFATNVAFQLAGQARRSPRDVATVLVRQFPEAAFVTSAEVAGAGFINFRLTNDWLYDVLRDVAAEAERYGRREPTGQHVQVEFVSANPTGPLHIGHARNAALGDALANLLTAAGEVVEREYYYNDAGRQMELFGRSVEARLLELLGHPTEIPEDGYHGEYVKEVAREVAARVEFDPPLVERDPETRWRDVLEHAAPIVLHWIERTLENFGVRFDTYVSERTLHQEGLIEEAVARLRAAAAVEEREGATWFLSTKFGDDKDRVLIRSNGQPTYFAADCAYLIHKFERRGFDRALYVWGADHHGDVIRVKGAAEALGYDPDAVEILIYQFVSFKRGGRPIRMSKRAGEIVTLDELIAEVGTDAARYTLLTRSNDSSIDFDIEEVKRQSLDNPVYYVQYAHARIASILRLAAERGIERKPVGEVDLSRLQHETELDLLGKIAELPKEVRTAADLRAPYRLTHYVEDLAAQFHRFYTECRVITDDEPLTQARLWLAAATKQAVANTLGILGVSAPESMDRIDATEEASS